MHGCDSRLLQRNQGESTAMSTPVNRQPHPAPDTDRRRVALRVTGTVQGVGFRPFVYNLARRLALGGFVRNDEQGVYIEIEGDHTSLAEFQRVLRSDPPPLAHIEGCTVESLVPGIDNQFVIDHTQRTNTSTTQVSPDIAICDECLREMRDPANRRYKYPFINCTNCGPRYTIIDNIPYDRPFTSMRVFPMCPRCGREYNDPADRRFHAQPISCPECGPTLWLHDGVSPMQSDDPVSAAIEAINDGSIVAIRGLGGFHLAVDATNESAVRRLRERKAREDKPFAVMMRDLQQVAEYCLVSSQEAAALQSRQRPIVLLQRRANGQSLAPSVAPDNNYLGVMLPYTPVHHLLFDRLPGVLVMTSGNISDEPIAIGNDEALSRLADIADVLLFHDREIRQRSDDSIVRILDKRTRTIRRSRGFVPAPIYLDFPVSRPILSCGADLKNTISLAHRGKVVLSQHIGDLDNPAALDFFRNSIVHLQTLMQIKPELIACDMHPEYFSSKWARSQTDLPVVEVQHHHAHLASVLVENGVTEATIGLILDGTGYGADGTSWGGEVLVGDLHVFERCAWLDPMPMPGGDTAARQPWRMAVSCLTRAGVPVEELLRLAPVWHVEPEAIAHVCRMIDRRYHSPLTSGCGRLFDAAAALLGVCTVNTYEARAASALEMLAGVKPLARDEAPHEVSIECTRGAITHSDLIAELYNSVRRGADRNALARLFHVWLAEKLIAAVRKTSDETGLRRVALSGGVFQNRLFFEYVITRLRADGFGVLTHTAVPTNDGGIALGQAAIANARCADNASG